MKSFQEIYTEFSYLKQRSNRSFITSTMSIALVLFILGLFSSFGFFGSAFVDYAKSSIPMRVFLNDPQKGGEDLFKQRIASLSAEIKQMAGVEDVKFISKDEAGKILLQKTGEDVVKLMDGVNPLLASLDIKLKSQYVQIDSVEKMKKVFLQNGLVAEIDYPVKMMQAIAKNSMSMYLLTLLLLLLTIVIAFYLITNTIRLSIYAQRLTIRTMQLIGATSHFVRKPFLRIGLIQGIAAGLLAVFLLLILVSLVSINIGTLAFSIKVIGQAHFFALLVGIVLFGAVLGYSASYFAVNRFLNKSLDELMQ